MADRLEFFFRSRTNRAISPTPGGFASAASWPISMAWSSLANVEGKKNWPSFLALITWLHSDR
jgi:hypothetical protein